MPEPDIYWQHDVLPPRKVTAELTPATTGGGRSITAVEEVVSFDAGYWMIVLDAIPLVSKAQKLAWRQNSAILGGRAGTCAVPIYDIGPQGATPWPPDGHGGFVTSYGKIHHTDGSLFSDHSGYYQQVITSMALEFSALGSNSVYFEVVNSDQLYPGVHFSVSNRLYRIMRITFQSGGVYRVTVWPPLREAITIGEAFEFDDPRCICRLLTDNEMQTGVDDYAGQTQARVAFEEAINVP